MLLEITCVAPLMITAVAEVGRTYVTWDEVPVPDKMTVPPGVSVELPMMKPDAELPVYIVPSAVNTGAAVEAGRVAVLSTVLALGVSLASVLAVLAEDGIASDSVDVGGATITILAGGELVVGGVEVDRLLSVVDEPGSDTST